MAADAIGMEIWEAGCIGCSAPLVNPDVTPMAWDVTPWLYAAACCAEMTPAT